MLSRLVPPMLLLLLAMSALAEVRTFTDTAGRTMIAELQGVEEDRVTVRRGDGRVFTFRMETLTENDQGYAREWRSRRGTEQAVIDRQKAAALQAAERRRRIAEFCILRHRSQVGNGECWTLAQEAFVASGASRPGEEIRVWGRPVDVATEDVAAGDIVEFRHAKIPGYGITGAEHTAVVIRGGRNGKCTLAEQNWGGVRKVRQVAVDLSACISGTVTVYRPQ